MISADGKELMDNILLSGMKDPRAKQMMLICKKYGLSVTDSIAMLLELSLLAPQEGFTPPEE